MEAEHALATHDPAILARLLPARERAAVEFLLGVRPDEARRLARDGLQVRIYVPYGHRWFRYYAAGRGVDRVLTGSGVSRPAVGAAKPLVRRIGEARLMAAGYRPSREGVARSSSE